MNLPNIAAAAILLLVSGRGSVGNSPVPTTTPLPPVVSRILDGTTPVLSAASASIPLTNSSNGGEVSTAQCRQVDGVFAGAYICSRTPIGHASKLGQDQNLFQCKQVNGPFAGAYICGRTLIGEPSKLRQDHKPVSAANSTIPVAHNSNTGELSSVECSQVSNGFAGGYVCGRTDSKLANK